MSSATHNMIAKCYIMQKRYKEALEELDAAYEVFQGKDMFWHRHTLMDRGRIYVLTGETEKAEQILETLMKDKGRLNHRIAVSGVLHALGRDDEAMDWLEAAATAREPHMAAIRKAFEFERLASHPRFQALLKRVGLAE